MPTVFWFTRDLRIQDNEALSAAVEHARHSDSRVVASYLLDVAEYRALSPRRRDSLIASLVALGSSIDSKLTIRQGENPTELAESLARLMQKVGATVVFATKSFEPKLSELQKQVSALLKERRFQLKLVGSNYAVAPGTVKKPDGTAYRVYTPFFKGWHQIGWPKPFYLSPGLDFEWHYFDSECDGFPVGAVNSASNTKAGEEFALRTWHRFRDARLYDYATNRNRADLNGTSHLSHALAHGEIHPRTLLADLRDVEGHVTFMKEIAWREFYADVTWNNPASVTDYLDSKFKLLRYDVGEVADARLEAWQQGKTGFPMVDAGMRQLLQDGWMHNRVRMIVASFLIKDLHLEWQQGASWFEKHLTDFDPASNSHGWQWTAGCGTDASPYYRVFNPITQGYKFDPNGDYVRKYVPELAHLEGASVHEPWLLLDGLAGGYPAPIVDHAAERQEALARLEELKLL